MMLYRNTKVKVCSPDRDTDCFGIFAGVLQGDTLALYLFMICLGYVFQTLIDLIKENSFMLKKKARSRQYHVEITTDTDDAVDLSLLINTPAQVESLLHSLE